MNNYDMLMKAVSDNIESANNVSGQSLAAANTYVAIAQVQATQAIAEAIRMATSRPTPYNLPPL